MYHAENPLTNKYTRQRACSTLAKSRNRRFAHEVFLRNVLAAPGSPKKNKITMFRFLRNTTLLVLVAFLQQCDYNN